MQKMLTSFKCEKLRLLFNTKKLTEKDKTILQRFLDTIFYTCGISFHNIYNLTILVILLKHDDTENGDEESI